MVRLVDREKREGKRWMEREVDLMTLPLYVRAPAPSSRWILCDNSLASKPPSRPRCAFIPARMATLRIYDDDGQSLGYRDGSDSKMVWIRFRWDNAAGRLTIEPHERMKQWPGGSRQFAVEIPGEAGSAKSVSFKGERVIMQL